MENIQTYLQPLKAILDIYLAQGGSDTAKFFDFSVNNLAKKFNISANEIKEMLIINK